MAVSTDSLGVLNPILDTEWMEAPRRSPVWVELLAIGWLLWLYDEVNNFSAIRQPAALAHARSILRLENLLHLNPELSLNAWAALHRGLALPMSDFYDIAHFVITFAVVGLLWWRFPEQYRPMRNSLVLINVVGFAVFWAYPLAPPRMLPAAGFVDLVAVTHAFGSWRTSAVASQANELAAMPSLHLAWACWTSLAVWRILPGRRWRPLLFLYPLMVAIVVMATANHFLLDVVGGVATMIASVLIAQWLSAARAKWWPTWTGPPYLLPLRSRTWIRDRYHARCGGRVRRRLTPSP